MEKKAKIFIASMGALISSAVIVGTATSIAWFDTRSKIEMDTNVVGSTEGSYFAYGKGSKDDPFGINKPRHLYNLAWLTYNGYFENKDNDGDDVKGDTFYFEIDPDINELDGLENNEPLVIPPIGTKEHPFYGTFNGNGKTIKNFVVSNNFTDYKKTPYNVDADSFVAPEIVGFFGVIGGYPGNSYTYSTNANEFKNTHLESITIKTATPKSLVGIAAGYVNGPLNNITTDLTSIDVAATTTTALSDFTSNLSDYGVVGFATTNYKKGIKKVSSQVYQVSTNTEKFVADASGSTSAWGGSIDMISMHQRLNAIFRSNRTVEKDIYSKYQSAYDLDGNVVSTYSDEHYNSRYAHTPTYNTNDSNYNEKIGSYVFWKDKDDYNRDVGNYNKNVNQDFLYMAGGHRSEKDFHSYYRHEGIKITDGTNYLTVDSFDSTTSGTLGNLTTSGPTDATVWVFSGDTSGTIYTDFYYNASGADHYQDGTSTRYYLTNSYGELVLSSTPTTWTKTIGLLGKVRYVNNNQFINYNGSNWVLSTMTDEPYLPAAPTYDFDDPEPKLEDFPNYDEPTEDQYPQDQHGNVISEPTEDQYPKDEHGVVITEPTEDQYPKDEHGNVIDEPVITDYVTEPAPNQEQYEAGNGTGTLNPSDYLENSYQIYYEDNESVRHYFNYSSSVTGDSISTSSNDTNGGIAYGWLLNINGSGKIQTKKKGSNTPYYVDGRNKSIFGGGDSKYVITTSSSSGDTFNCSSSGGKYSIRYDGGTLITRNFCMEYNSGSNIFVTVSSSDSYVLTIRTTAEVVKEYNHNVWATAYAQWESNNTAKIAEFNAAHEQWEHDQQEQYGNDHGQWQSDKDEQFDADHSQWEHDQQEQYGAAHDQWEHDQQEQYEAAHSQWVEDRDNALAEYEAAMEYYNTVTRAEHDEWERTVNTLEDTNETNINGPDNHNYHEDEDWEYQAVVNNQHIYDTSYFPINVNSANDVAKDNTKVLYEPNDSNTGYFVGGGYSNLRFGRYPISSLSSASYDRTNKVFKSVKTYDGNNVEITSDYASEHFEKYNNTISKLENVMKSNSDGYVYGMHFFNDIDNPTKVDIKYKTYAKWASINNVEKQQYELLANSVEFNLKEQGIINFVAGTYGKLSGSNRTSDADSFFTLNLVQRDANEKIINVYEIEEVLSDGKQNHAYVYKLSNGKYTVPYAYGVTNRSIKYKLDAAGNTTTNELAANGEYELLSSVPTGYTTLKFNTQWLKMTGYSSGGSGNSAYYTHSYAYYFEIPINDGEYALGNVETGNFGAYLMYLDIGASALSLSRTCIYEHFKETTYDYALPLGVMIKDLSSTIAFDYTNSATVAIVPHYIGVVTFDRDSTGADLSVSGSGTNSTVQYASDLITSLHKPSSEGGGTITPSGTAVVKDTYQLRYYDYNENTGAVIVTILTDVFINGVQEGTRTVSQKYLDGSDVLSVEVYNSTINGATVDETGQPAEVASGAKLNDIQINSIDLQRASNDIVIEFKFTDKTGVTHEISYSLDFDDEVTGPTFEKDINGYTITITVSGGSIFVYVTQFDPTNVNEGYDYYEIFINGVLIYNTTEDGQPVIEIPIP